MWCLNWLTSTADILSFSDLIALMFVNEFDCRGEKKIIHISVEVRYKNKFIAPVIKRASPGSLIQI